MKKCCSKTLLNEWKTFLKEIKSLTKPNYENGQKVKVNHELKLIPKKIK